MLISSSTLSLPSFSSQLLSLFTVIGTLLRPFFWTLHRRRRPHLNVPSQPYFPTSINNQSHRWWTHLNVVSQTTPRTSETVNRLNRQYLLLNCTLSLSGSTLKGRGHVETVVEIDSYWSLTLSQTK